MRTLKISLLIFTLLSLEVFSQSPTFYPVELIRLQGYGMGINVEVHDINNDENNDIVVGNWNDTYVYYGGEGMLDNIVDLVFTGRCLAVCDYNGDGYKDLITMHLTSYDSTRNDYNGEILFYYGSNATPNIDKVAEHSIPLPTLYPTRDKFSFASFKPGTEYGDFNKDGKIDVVIHSLESVVEQGNIGVTYIYMGNQTPPDTATYKVQGRQQLGMPLILYFGDYFQVGDINNDDYDDLVLSSVVQTVPVGSVDSLNVLHIYMGSDNFTFVENGETFRYESRVKNSDYSYGWVNKKISMMDLNGDGFDDIIIGHYHRDSTNHVHYGSVNVLDTIPSFYLTDPDTTRDDTGVGAMCHDVGDWNNDGEGDYLLKQARYKGFSLHLGGPHINNNNPYGLRGLLEAKSEFPSKVINCGDQDGDGVKDFVVTADPYDEDDVGYVIIFKGRDDIVVSVQDEPAEEGPHDFYLENNYPNPFNLSTRIKYYIPSVETHSDASLRVTLKVFDVLGNEVATLVNEEKPAGSYEVEFNGNGLTSGIYFYRLQAGEDTAVKKMILLK